MSTGSDLRSGGSPAERASDPASGCRAELIGVERHYRRGEEEVAALRGIDLVIESGAKVALMGPSGSGKSTLLHILGLLDTADAGTYRLGGDDVSKLDDDGRARRRGQLTGFVFQSFHLVPHLTIQENVALPLVYRGMDEEPRAERARQLLTRVGLGHRLDHRPEELSGGEQQRAAVARALAPGPRLLLADEPTGNLDHAASAAVLDQLDLIHSEGTTVVVVTHDERVAERAGRVLEIVDGRLR